MRLATPLLLGQGELQQALTWNSSGPWQLTETISYRTPDTVLVQGDENTFRSKTNPEALAFHYAIWISQVNEHQALKLFIEELDETLDPDCGPALTRVELTIRDTAVNEERRWVRCAEGTLGTIVSARAGPDPAASRVADAARLLREYAFPAGFTSSIHPSFPFATLARGETAVPLDAPWVIETGEAWSQFWTVHAAGVPLPSVDFSREIVLVAADGERYEAGEEVEIRRVLPVEHGTVVQVVRRVPGDFCSPVSRTHRPVHVVVAPRAPPPIPGTITFAQIQREEVPCGPF